LARQVRALANSKQLSSNKVIVGLIEEGLKAQEREKERFFSLAEALIQSKDEQEQKRIKQELAKMTFGS